MAVTSERLVNALGKLTSDAEVKALLRELDLPEQSAPIRDGVSSDYEATKHGVAVFFRTAKHLRNIPAYQSCPPDVPVFSEVAFSRKGFGGGPGFSGALPHELTWADNREGVRARLGAPFDSATVGAIDRWMFGERYLSIMFYRDPSRGIMRVTCGLDWVL
jgi:hypothetical protein